MSYLIAFLLGMAPISEVRGAIPYAVAHGLAFPWNVLVPMAGNILVILPLLYLLKPVLRFIKNLSGLQGFKNWVDRYEDRALRKMANYQNALLFGLFVFVAIPLPSTGAYTGALAAVLLRIPKQKAFAAIALGVVTASAIVYLAVKGLIHLF